MTSSCTTCGISFEITDQDLAFYKEISPEFNGKKYNIPPPLLCPLCRLHQRMTFRNERTLYKRKSDLSGKELVCMFAEGNPYKVCDQDEWWSDSWDPMAHGKEYDPDRPFFDQLLELNLAIPHPSLNTSNTENSYYTNFSLNVRNCYLCYGMTNSEDCMYNKFAMGCQNVFDSLSLYECERCYEGIASQNCYGCFFFLNCKNCNDCLFIEECLSCTDCMLCFGLRNKQYCYKNQQLTKEQYDQKKKEILPLTAETIPKLQKEFYDFSSSLPHRASHIVASDDCTGDMISNSKGCHECFDINNCEDCTYTAFTPNGVSTYDTTFTAPLGPKWSNHCISAMGTRMMGVFMCWETNDAYYSINCRNCDYIFGCVGLKRKKYCVLNKEYTKEEYDALVPRIIEQMTEEGTWGQFLPVDLSHFAYNETIANEYFPMTKEEVERRGWKWKEEQEEILNVEKTIPGEKLPGTIDDIPDDILNWTITCEQTQKPFRIMKQELAFYRDLNLPVPRLHPDERHRRRLAQKNPYTLQERTCAKCKQNVKSNIPSDTPLTVYCEECYLKEVY